MIIEKGAGLYAGFGDTQEEASHLVEPLNTPAVRLENFQYTAASWARDILEVTMNTGERYQFMRVPRRLAIQFVRNPANELLKGYRFERVRTVRDCSRQRLSIEIL